MTTTEIAKNIRNERTSDTQFISWWRKEEDFLDYDLIDRFLENAGQNREVGGYELLTTEQMWERLEGVCGKRIMKTQKSGEPLIEWDTKGGVRTCPYTPKSMIEIFDVETRGNVVD
ncbi:hypothetical protein [Geobacter sp. AOG1]|uniref:hypothetical protein n=1 Tax=Geobacter sp. AOG1 TaxID=1566346 RepID=UPI001CC7587B|nr:hypothetical protein [Geobacter sp. AOG1]GFE59178.1 hypothetical protein AOG1_30580 [Geobacter sp. AOG1]